MVGDTLVKSGMAASFRASCDERVEVVERAERGIDRVVAAVRRVVAKAPVRIRKANPP